MSHFSVIVCLPGDTDLTKLEETLSDVMEPWDESRDVEPYRSYEDGAAEEHWWVEAVRDGAAHHHAGTLDECDRKSVRYGQPEKTDAELRAEYADDARWAEQLGDAPTTWERVAAAYNEKWGYGSALATAGDDSDSDTLFHDPESGRAYRMSTYNPESKWDYWSIGGRWSGYFIVKDEPYFELDKAGNPKRILVVGDQAWDSPKESRHPGRNVCDGGPISKLDLDAMRDVEATQALDRYDRYEALVAQHGPAKAWSHFTGLVDVGELTIDEARRQYRDQPLIAAVNALNRTDQWLVGWGTCPVEEFLPPREEYAAEARRGAVPGYALVTLGREWVAPGRMGWFGMSSDGPGERSGYHHAVNTYLDQLDPATVLVVLDCHI